MGDVEWKIKSFTDQFKMSTSAVLQPYYLLFHTFDWWLQIVNVFVTVSASVVWLQWDINHVPIFLQLGGGKGLGVDNEALSRRTSKATNQQAALIFSVRHQERLFLRSILFLSTKTSLLPVVNLYIVSDL